MVRFSTPFGEPRRPSSAVRLRQLDKSKREDGAGGSSSAGAGSVVGGTQIVLFTRPSDVASLKPLSDQLRARVGLDATKACALCKHAFRPESLRTRVSSKALLEQRARWGLAALRRRDIAASSLYSERRVCVFCAQFFDADVLALDDGVEQVTTSNVAGGPVQQARVSVAVPGDSLECFPFTTSFAETPMRQRRLLSVDRRTDGTSANVTPRPAAAEDDLIPVPTPTRARTPSGPGAPAAAAATPSNFDEKHRGPKAMNDVASPSSVIAPQRAQSASMQRRLDNEFCRRVLLETAARNANHVAGRHARESLARSGMLDASSDAPPLLVATAKPVRSLSLKRDLVKECLTQHRRMNEALLANRAARQATIGAIEPTARFRPTLQLPVGLTGSSRF
jgi:hypothetical protein